MLALSALLLTGCTAPRPAHHADSLYGIVWAETDAEARDVASHVDALMPRVTQLLGVADPPPVEIWVQREPRFYRFGSGSGREGFFLPDHGRIHVRGGPLSGPERPDVIAHELTHLLMDGRRRAGYPWAIGEALADHVAQACVDSPETRFDRAFKVLHALSVTGGAPTEIIASYRPPSREQPFDWARVTLDDDLVRLTPEDIDALLGSEEPDRESVARSLGFVLLLCAIERWGFDGTLRRLDELLVGRRLPTDADAAWRELAGLSSDPQRWEARLQGLISAETLRSVFLTDRLLRDGIAEAEGWTALIRVWASEYPGPTPAEFFRGGRPALRLARTDITTNVEDVPLLRSRIEEDWPAAAVAARP